MRCSSDKRFGKGGATSIVPSKAVHRPIGRARKALGSKRSACSTRAGTYLSHTVALLPKNSTRSKSPVDEDCVCKDRLNIGEAYTAVTCEAQQGQVWKGRGPRERAQRPLSKPFLACGLEGGELCRKRERPSPSSRMRRQILISGMVGHSTGCTPTGTRILPPFLRRTVRRCRASHSMQDTIAHSRRNVVD